MVSYKENGMADLVFHFWALSQKLLLASSCLFVRPSIRTERLGFYWTDFMNLIFELVLTSGRQLQDSLNSDKNKGYFQWKQYTFLIRSSSLARFFLERKMFQTNVLEEMKIHILCSITLFRKSCRLWDNVKSLCRMGQATEGNMAHAHCMLDT